MAAPVFTMKLYSARGRIEQTVLRFEPRLTSILKRTRKTVRERFDFLLPWKMSLDGRFSLNVKCGRFGGGRAFLIPGAKDPRALGSFCLATCSSS